MCARRRSRARSAEQFTGLAAVKPLGKWRETDFFSPSPFSASFYSVFSPSRSMICRSGLKSNTIFNGKRAFATAACGNGCFNACQPIAHLSRENRHRRGEYLCCRNHASVVVRSPTLRDIPAPPLSYPPLCKGVFLGDVGGGLRGDPSPK